MTSSYLRSKKAKHGKPRTHHSGAQATDLSGNTFQPRKQLDGSPVTSPPGDPVNSEETLKRNQKGNS